MSTHRDVVALVREIAPSAPVPVARDLERILSAMEPTGELPGRTRSIEQLAAWLAEVEPFELPDTALVGGRSGAERVWLLVATLKASSVWRHALARLVCSVLIDTSSLRLFARTGLPSELRLFSELADRTVKSVLPHPPEDGELAALLTRVFPSAASLRWVESAPPTLVGELVDILLDAPELGTVARQHLVDDAADALAILAMRVATLGLDEDIRARSALPRLSLSPYFDLSRVCSALLESRDAAQPFEALRVEAVGLLPECEAVLHRVTARLDVGGVSVDLVFRVELLERLLRRIAHLLVLIDRPKAATPEYAANMTRFCRELVSESISDHSAFALLQENGRLLARRIVERAGETGEHYITASRAEWHAMLRSAGGGGVLTAGTTVAKFWVGWAHFPYFFQALFYGLDYSISFVLLHFVGGTLATKQPSMTAAALAASFDTSGHGDMDGLVDQIARTARSQLAAILGNLGLVIPACAGIHFAYMGMSGEPFLDAETATDVINSLRPTHSGTLFYAAVTGVLLWLSSILGGAVENWSAIHRLPEAFHHHPQIIRAFGAKRAAAFARSFARNVSPVGSSIALGFLLGATPIVGKFFGAPLDVRHVTLSTGALTFAIASVGSFSVVSHPIQEAMAGIVMIGFLNFTVSFSLALSVALRARNVPFRALGTLAWAVFRRFLRAPSTFLYPPKGEPSGNPAH